MGSARWPTELRLPHAACDAFAESLRDSCVVALSVLAAKRDYNMAVAAPAGCTPAGRPYRGQTFTDNADFRLSMFLGTRTSANIRHTVTHHPPCRSMSTPRAGTKAPEPPHRARELNVGFNETFAIENAGARNATEGIELQLVVPRSTSTPKRPEGAQHVSPDP